MEPISIETFYTGFYIISQLKEVETDKYNYFLGDTLKRMGFLSFNRAYDLCFIADGSRERIEANGIKILSNAKVVTGYCLMGLIIETLDNDNKITDEMRETVKEWMKSYNESEGKDNKNYEIFVEIMNSFLNTDLTEAQLKFLTNVVELGKTDLKGVEEDIIKDAERRLAQKTPILQTPYSKNRHARAIINLSLKNGIRTNLARALINTFNSMSSRYMSASHGRTFP